MSEYILSAQLYSLKEFTDMCYFLPRILELIVNNQFSWYSGEYFFRRLFNEKQFLGTDEELDFLQTFFLEYWINYLNNKDFDIDIISLMGMILGNGGIAVKPLLAKWSQINSYHSTYQFALFMIASDKSLYCISGIEREEIDNDIKQWLSNQQTYDKFSNRLISAYFDEKASEEDKLYIESALTVYQHFRKIS